MREAAFARHTVRWLVGLCTVSFLGALALSVFGPDFEEVPSSGADSYSRAAIGHLAFKEMLRRLDVPVVASRHATADKTRGDALLLLAEPRDCPPGSPHAQDVAALLEAAPRALLVLPKWDGSSSLEDPGWVERIDPVAEDEVIEVLRVAGVEATIRRAPAAAASRWHANRLGHDPTFPLDMVQLLDETDLEPLVACPQGTLVGLSRRDDRSLLVLSDPDILANAGLHHGDNAALALAVVDLLRPEGGAVVWDETVHGHERTPSVWRELFDFPLVLLVAQAALVLVVLLWAGMGRFGAPERPAPPLEPGHAFLIENTAELLRYRGHLESVLPRYLESAVQDARRALGAPPELGRKELAVWLDRVAAARGVRARVADLETETRRAIQGGRRASRVLAAAGRIHRWKQEILHGPSGRTQHP